MTRERPKVASSIKSGPSALSYTMSQRNSVGSLARSSIPGIEAVGAKTARFPRMGVLQRIQNHSPVFIMIPD
jgi:hypothetical protein